MNIAPFRDPIASLYKAHAAGSSQVDPSWEALFDGIENVNLGESSAGAGVVDPYRTALILGRIIEQFRWRGHLAANLDPLGLARRPHDPEVLLDLVALSLGDLGVAPAGISAALPKDANAVAIVARLKQIYCGTIGYEFMHVESAAAREWLRGEIEAAASDPPAKARIAAAEKLIEADEFERFLQKRFVGKKVFGAEGAESLLPLLWSILETGVAAGIRSIVMGGTSRGRLNQLVNFVGKPPQALFAELAAKTASPAASGKSGDVPYHLGLSTCREAGDYQLTLAYCPNPSHLEAVNTVALGRVRAMQDELGGGGEAKRAIMPLLVHTDAAFAGQGVVAEAIQLSGLRSYTAGGTVHVIINNQIGFTTEPSDGRTSRYCTDAAKGIGAPVFHVNADDVDAVLKAGRLAAEYRQRFHGDAVIDLICYRRRGHNELDEPAFTQPLMYQRAAQHPGARRLYLDRLQEEGLFLAQREQAFSAAYAGRLDGAYKAAASYRQNASAGGSEDIRLSTPASPAPNGLTMPKLRALAEALSSIPAGIAPHPKVSLIFEQRAACAKTGSSINWGFAEALALGSLIAEGVPVRLSGQDTPRGAFSHRHFYVHDQSDGRRASIFDNLPQPKASSWLIESPLAEYATLGFEYGYSVACPRALVIWEAQFGDFANVAQPIFDQFISSGLDKWDEVSRLTVLMPHGLEGQGAEHSSGRIERFLQMCAMENMTIANCTTPANYFHLLRRQAHFAECPLIVFTPKSLLRHKLAVSSFEDMAEGTGFKALIAPDVRAPLRRLVLCTGKIFWELEAERRRLALDHVGIARIEQLYPFPDAELAQLLSALPDASIVWCQEEPQNMGAWSFAAPLIEAIGREQQRQSGLSYVGRAANPSPSFGNTEQHNLDQACIIAAALGEE